MHVRALQRVSVRCSTGSVGYAGKLMTSFLGDVALSASLAEQSTRVRPRFCRARSHVFAGNRRGLCGGGSSDRKPAGSTSLLHVHVLSAGLPRAAKHALFAFAKSSMCHTPLHALSRSCTSTSWNEY